jgi:hypothetical protein
MVLKELERMQDTEWVEEDTIIGKCIPPNVIDNGFIRKNHTEAIKATSYQGLLHYAKYAMTSNIAVEYVIQDKIKAAVNMKF